MQWWRISQFHWFLKLFPNLWNIRNLWPKFHITRKMLYLPIKVVITYLYCKVLQKHLYYIRLYNHETCFCYSCRSLISRLPYALGLWRTCNYTYVIIIMFYIWLMCIRIQIAQPTFTCSKLTVITINQGVKYVQS